ncbi:MAG: type II toxin-antitoxin system RelE/ParE family toxin [Rhizobiaceae bacterium]|nr:type II toxin-antitoxin system RelE/ParE family toxin [Rhizobiaceae bacterium]
MRHRFTRQADRDLLRIFRDSIKLFGAVQAHRYMDLINTALRELRSDAFRATSKARPEIRSGVRSLHLQVVARRSGGASHILYYAVESSLGDDAELVILRVLGDRMDPARRVTQALREEDRRSLS